jgi:hypothetical protein
LLGRRELSERVDVRDVCRRERVLRSVVCRVPSGLRLFDGAERVFAGLSGGVELRDDADV